MERVLVIGSPGAGKSTLATELARRTALPLFHLDKLHWKPGWVEPGQAEFDAVLTDVTAQPRWIIDGNYGRTLPLRLARADTVIDLDLPAWRCVIQAIGRVARSHGTVRPDMAPDCPERIDLEFLHYIAAFRTRNRPRIEAKMDGFTGRRIRLTSRVAVRDFVAGLAPPA